MAAALGGARVPLDLLPGFVAVAEEMHIGRAARRLAITPQALSGQLKRLESHVGATLFERTTRRVALTAVGQRLLDDIAAPLAHIHTGLSVAAATPAPRSVCVSLDLPQRWTERVGAWTRERGVEGLVLSGELTHTANERLASGALDAVLTLGAADTGAVVGTEEVVALVPDQHPTARAGRLGAGDLDGVLLVVPSADDGSYRAALVERFSGSMVEAPPLATLTNGVLAAALRGGVAAALPRAMVPDGLAHLVTVPWEPPLHIPVVLRTGRATDVVLADLAGFLSGCGS